MCESISTDVDNIEFVQSQVTKTVGENMGQSSNASDLEDSSLVPAEVPEMVNEPMEQVTVELESFASECEDSTARELENSGPVSGEVLEELGAGLLEDSTSGGLENSNPVPDGVLEQVADRLRIIGDEMDSDIRQNRMLGRQRAAGLPVRDLNVIVDLFPMHSTARKSLVVVGDLAGETLARDLIHVTLRRALIAAGSALAHALLCELLSTNIACPVDFRLKWSAIKWVRWSSG